LSVTAADELVPGCAVLSEIGETTMRGGVRAVVLDAVGLLVPVKGRMRMRIRMSEQNSAYEIDGVVRAERFV